MSLTLDQPNMALDTGLPVTDKEVIIGNQQPLGRWINKLFAVLKGVGPQLRVVATLDFPNTAAQSSSDLTVSVTGAAVGQMVALGAPSSAAGTGYTAFVSAPSVVTVRFLNASAVAVNPASADFAIAVLQ